MQRINSSKEAAVNSIKSLGVFFTTENSEIKHVGLLYRDPDSQEVRSLHLAWHHKLVDEPADTVDWWIFPGVDELRLIQVAAISRQISRANGRSIPYAFSHPNDCFDQATGQYLLGPTRLGLTCASFVLAVFHRAGLPLIDYSSWPTNRGEDVQFQNWIVDMLEGADQAHADAVRKDIGTVRFRPDEVAGSVLENVPPAVAFSRARGNADALKRKVSTVAATRGGPC